MQRASTAPGRACAGAVPAAHAAGACRHDRAPRVSPLRRSAPSRAAHDPDRFLCALFAPRGAARGAVRADRPQPRTGPRAGGGDATRMAALIRLQWWRDAIEEARAGRPPRRHEVAGAAARARSRAGALDPDALLAMVDAREAEAEEAHRDRAGFRRLAARHGRRLVGGGGPGARRRRGAGARCCARSAPPMAWPACCASVAGACGAGPLPAAARTAWRAAGLSAEAVVAAPGAPALGALVREMAAEGLVALRWGAPGRPAGLHRRRAAGGAGAARPGAARGRPGGRPGGRGVDGSARRGWAGWRGALMRSGRRRRVRHLSVAHIAADVVCLRLIGNNLVTPRL